MTSTFSSAPSTTQTRVPARMRVIAFVLCITATLLTYVLFVAYRDVNVWEGFRAAKAFLYPVASDPVFPDSIFRTRANAWSNLAYVYVGLFAIVACISDLRRRSLGNFLAASPEYSLFFGLSCVYLGIGSGIFHASLTHWGQQLDVASMYSTLVALIALNLGRLHPRIARLGGVSTAWLWIPMAIAVDVLLYLYKWSMSSGVVLPTLIGTVCIFGLAARLRGRTQIDVRWLFGAFATLIIAVGCRRLDAVGPLADPKIWLTGHALWHCYTAACLGCMYVYYRSERADMEADKALEAA